MMDSDSVFGASPNSQVDSKTKRPRYLASSPASSSTSTPSSSRILHSNSKLTRSSFLSSTSRRRSAYDQFDEIEWVVDLTSKISGALTPHSSSSPGVFGGSSLKQPKIRLPKPNKEFQTLERQVKQRKVDPSADISFQDSILETPLLEKDKNRANFQNDNLQPHISGQEWLKAAQASFEAKQVEPKQFSENQIESNSDATSPMDPVVQRSLFAANSLQELFTYGGLVPEEGGQMGLSEILQSAEPLSISSDQGPSTLFDTFKMQDGTLDIQSLLEHREKLSQNQEQQQQPSHLLSHNLVDQFGLVSAPATLDAPAASKSKPLIQELDDRTDVNHEYHSDLGQASSTFITRGQPIHEVNSSISGQDSQHFFNVAQPIPQLSLVNGQLHVVQQVEGGIQNGHDNDENYEMNSVSSDSEESETDDEEDDFERNQYSEGHATAMDEGRKELIYSYKERPDQQKVNDQEEEEVEDEEEEEEDDEEDEEDEMVDEEGIQAQEDRYGPSWYHANQGGTGGDASEPIVVSDSDSDADSEDDENTQDIDESKDERSSTSSKSKDESYNEDDSADEESEDQIIREEVDSKDSDQGLRWSDIQDNDNDKEPNTSDRVATPVGSFHSSILPDFATTSATVYGEQGNHFWVHREDANPSYSNLEGTDTKLNDIDPELINLSSNSPDNIQSPPILFAPLPQTESVSVSVEEQADAEDNGETYECVSVSAEEPGNVQDNGEKDEPDSIIQDEGMLSPGPQECINSAVDVQPNVVPEILKGRDFLNAPSHNGPNVAEGRIGLPAVDNAVASGDLADHETSSDTGVTSGNVMPLQTTQFQDTSTEHLDHTTTEHSNAASPKTDHSKSDVFQAEPEAERLATEPKKMKEENHDSVEPTTDSARNEESKLLEIRIHPNPQCNGPSDESESLAAKHGEMSASSDVESSGIRTPLSALPMESSLRHRHRHHHGPLKPTTPSHLQIRHPSPQSREQANIGHANDARQTSETCSTLSPKPQLEGVEVGQGPDDSVGDSQTQSPYPDQTTDEPVSVAEKHGNSGAENDDGDQDPGFDCLSRSTRSQCSFHRLKFLDVEGHPMFIVPQCSILHDVAKEEGARDCGEASEQENNTKTDFDPEDLPAEMHHRLSRIIGSNMLGDVAVIPGSSAERMLLQKEDDDILHLSKPLVESQATSPTQDEHGHEQLQLNQIQQETVATTTRDTTDKPSNEKHKDVMARKKRDSWSPKRSGGHQRKLSSSFGGRRSSARRSSHKQGSDDSDADADAELTSPSLGRKPNSPLLLTDPHVTKDEAALDSTMEERHDDDPPMDIFVSIDPNESETQLETSKPRTRKRRRHQKSAANHQLAYRPTEADAKSDSNSDTNELEPKTKKPTRHSRRKSADSLWVEVETAMPSHHAADENNRGSTTKKKKRSAIKSGSQVDCAYDYSKQEGSEDEVDNAVTAAPTRNSRKEEDAVEQIVGQETAVTGESELKPQADLANEKDEMHDETKMIQPTQTGPADADEDGDADEEMADTDADGDISRGKATSSPRQTRSQITKVSNQAQSSAPRTRNRKKKSARRTSARKSL